MANYMSKKKVEEMNARLRIKHDKKEQLKNCSKADPVKKNRFMTMTERLESTVNNYEKLKREHIIEKASHGKTKKKLERMKDHYRASSETNNIKEHLIEKLKAENDLLIKDRQIFRDDLIAELKRQLDCSKTEYYTPTTIIGKIMNTISKAQPFSVVLK